MRAHRTADFERRSVLYARYDAQLREQTRFFGAAAVVNEVLARLFAFMPTIRAPRCLGFLNEVGAALEADNVLYARVISWSKSSYALDHALVCAEQARLQRYISAHQAQQPRQWESTRRELNGLLNDQYAASFFAPWCEGKRVLSQVLQDVRGNLGAKLDFAVESHRIRIGMKLIEYIRLDSQLITKTCGWIHQRRV
jgi:hypothetical protein